LYTTFASVIALIIAATAQSYFVLASLLIGITSIVPQLILPLAASLSAPEERGKVVGTIMSGLLVGILLSRTLSGFIGDTLGWRAMFWIASGLCLVLFLSSRNNFLIISQSLMARTNNNWSFHLNQEQLYCVKRL
jgi:predicted MFS family arabinose efflux permease